LENKQISSRSLVSEQVEAIESVFKKHIKESSDRMFLKATWEEIYSYIKSKGIANIEKETIIKYFAEKLLAMTKKGNFKGRSPLIFVAPIEPEQGHSTLGGRKKKKTGIFAGSVVFFLLKEKKKNQFFPSNTIFFSFSLRSDTPRSIE
jgi:hypothetical protein